MYTIINYGQRRQFPTCVGNFLINKGETIRVKSEVAARQLEKQPFVVVRGLNKPEEPGKIEFSYRNLGINELRKIAARFGIGNSFFMKKDELIKKLEEQNGT